MIEYWFHDSMTFCVSLIRTIFTRNKTKKISLLEPCVRDFRCPQIRPNHYFMSDLGCHLHITRISFQAHRGTHTHTATSPLFSNSLQNACSTTDWTTSGTTTEQKSARTRTQTHTHTDTHGHDPPKHDCGWSTRRCGAREKDRGWDRGLASRSIVKDKTSTSYSRRGAQRLAKSFCCCCRLVSIFLVTHPPPANTMTI